MKKILTFIVAYSFVIITGVQLLVNIISIFFKEFYYKNWFIIANLVGVSFIYLIPMVAVVFLLKYCYVSRICAIAQVILSILWLVIQKDNVYNISAQLIVGFLALLFTYFKIRKIKKN
jgi:hypothetical protein